MFNKQNNEVQNQVDQETENSADNPFYVVDPLNQFQNSQQYNNQDFQQNYDNQNYQQYNNDQNGNEQNYQNYDYSEWFSNEAQLEAFNSLKELIDTKRFSNAEYGEYDAHVLLYSIVSNNENSLSPWPIYNEDGAKIEYQDTDTLKELKTELNQLYAEFQTYDIEREKNPDDINNIKNVIESFDALYKPFYAPYDKEYGINRPGPISPAMYVQQTINNPPELSREELLKKILQVYVDVTKVPVQPQEKIEDQEQDHENANEHEDFHMTAPSEALVFDLSDKQEFLRKVTAELGGPINAESIKALFDTIHTELKDKNFSSAEDIIKDNDGSTMKKIYSAIDHFCACLSAVFGLKQTNFKDWADTKSVKEAKSFVSKYIDQKNSNQTQDFNIS